MNPTFICFETRKETHIKLITETFTYDICTRHNNVSFERLDDLILFLKIYLHFGQTAKTSMSYFYFNHKIPMKRNYICKTKTCKF